MRIIRSPHCRVHGLGQSLCCRASPRWAQGGKWGMEGQEQPLRSCCGRETWKYSELLCNDFLQSEGPREKLKCLKLQLILEGENPHDLEWELYISETPVCENVSKLWYSLRQQTFPLSFFALRWPFGLLHKDSSTTEDNCDAFSARFSEKADTFWGVTDFRLKKVSAVCSPPLLYYYLHFNGT